MTRPPVHVRRIGAVLAIAAFLPGLAGEAYGPHGPALADAHPATTLPEKHRPHGSSEPVPGESHEPLRCTCIGTCHGAAVTPHPAPPVTLGTSRISHASRALDPPVEDISPPRAAFLLPYPNGPPAV